MAHWLFGDLRVNPWYRRSILTAYDFTRTDLELIFGVADKMGELVKSEGGGDLLRHKILAALFYEHSTRTVFSFSAAMQRLSGGVIGGNMQSSSEGKGESFADTIRNASLYADVILIRHPEEGKAAEAARYSRKPVINAGDGENEHPTQALLDLYTIQRELKGIDDLVITIVGDLKYGRVVHSLVLLLSLFNVRLNYVWPLDLALPTRWFTAVQSRKILQWGYGLSELESILPETDVLYVTRVQKERFSDPREYKRMKGSYVITPKILKHAKEKMILMHSLPRTWEIPEGIREEFDSDSRVAYFRQAQNGLAVRMALLALLLCKPETSAAASG